MQVFAGFVSYKAINVLLPFCAGYVRGNICKPLSKVFCFSWIWLVFGVTTDKTTNNYEKNWHNEQRNMTKLHVYRNHEFSAWSEAWNARLFATFIQFLPTKVAPRLNRYLPQESKKFAQAIYFLNAIESHFNVNIVTSYKIWQLFRHFSVWREGDSFNKALSLVPHPFPDLQFPHANE